MSEPEKIIDLYLLPYRFGPFHNYGEYLLWKLSSMKFGETFQLRFFSAFVVKRYAQGYILENTQTGQLWGAEPHEYPRLLEYIQTQRKQTKASVVEKALVRMVTANKLFRTGLGAEEIAKQLKTSVFRARSYIRFGSFEVVQ
jgi:hypothetical protein